MPSKKPSTATKVIFAILVPLLLASLATQLAQGQKFRVLHTFAGSDGYGPVGQLVRDSAGNLYGVASAGGSGTCTGQSGCGTAFKLDGTGKQVWVHSFQNAAGQDPGAGLLRDSSGNLYGTTIYGGDTACGDPLGCGTVFELNKSGKEKVLYKFTGDPDGWFPGGPLVRDGAGNLYGITQLGGTTGLGAIFKIDASGKETILYSFTGGSDGCFPDAGVILDAAGNLYGVAPQGGAGFCNSGLGVVYELDTTGKQTVLHTFGGGDGAYPSSVLLFDSAGNLYGTTQAGGSSIVCGGGCGTVFELSPDGDGSWTENVLYSFCSLSSCADGEEPIAGPLARDAGGGLYGTTYFGGANPNCNGDACGAVFKLDTTGKETVLHSFTGGSDGANPLAGLTMDSTGNLYGATVFGGNPACKGGCGVVFKLAP
jgi:uncharacterized repeat protein (TIGR03803 family)